MMNIIINNTSGKPIYQQIYDQISAQIIKGELRSGFCLPPIRTVAKELRISVITVKKAWEELEHGRFINTMAGKGCFVAELSDLALELKRRDVIAEKLRKDIEYYKSLGLSKSEALALLEKHFDG